MPRLLVFAPCERVIVEQGSGIISLISILQDITVTVPSPPATIESDAVAMTRWYILTIWRRNDNESEGVSFRQRIALNSPTGATFQEIFTDFTLSKATHRNIAAIEGFPVAAEGQYVLRLSLAPAGSERFDEIAEYPLLLKHASPTLTGSTP